VSAISFTNEMLEAVISEMSERAIQEGHGPDAPNSQEIGAIIKLPAFKERIVGAGMTAGFPIETVQDLMRLISFGVVFFRYGEAIGRLEQLGAYPIN